MALIAVATGLVPVWPVQPSAAAPPRTEHRGHGGRTSGCSRSCRLTKASIWTMRSDGSHPVRVTSRRSVRPLPRWSPNGRALAFVRIDPASRRRDPGDAGDERGLRDPPPDHLDDDGERRPRLQGWLHGTRLVAGLRPPRLHLRLGTEHVAPLPGPLRRDRPGVDPAPVGCRGLTPTWSPDSAPLVFARHNRSVNVGSPGRVSLWKVAVGPGAVPSSYVTRQAR